MKNKVAKLEEAIKTRRHVEKAFGILMEAHRLTEIDACEHMRSKATSFRVTVSEIATLAIDANEAMEKLGLSKGSKL